MSDSVRPHRQQPIGLRHPWDSPGKNTGVGCHFILQCMKGESESEVAQSVRLLVTPWTAANQIPPSIGVSRQKYWNGMPLPSPFPMTRLYQNFVWVKVKLKKTSITAKILLSESCKLFPCITMQIDKMKLDALDFCLMGELILNVILYYPLGY